LTCTQQVSLHKAADEEKRRAQGRKGKKGKGKGKGQGRARQSTASPLPGDMMAEGKPSPEELAALLAMGGGALDGADGAKGSAQGHAKPMSPMCRKPDPVEGLKLPAIETPARMAEGAGALGGAGEATAKPQQGADLAVKGGEDPTVHGAGKLDGADGASGVAHGDAKPDPVEGFKPPATQSGARMAEGAGALDGADGATAEPPQGAELALKMAPGELGEEGAKPGALDVAAPKAGGTCRPSAPRRWPARAARAGGGTGPTPARPTRPRTASPRRARPGRAPWRWGGVNMVVDDRAEGEPNQVARPRGGEGADGVKGEERPAQPQLGPGAGRGEEDAQPEREAEVPGGVAVAAENGPGDGAPQHREMNEAGGEPVEELRRQQANAVQVPEGAAPQGGEDVEGPKGGKRPAESESGTNGARGEENARGPADPDGVAAEGAADGEGGAWDRIRGIFAKGMSFMWGLYTKTVDCATKAMEAVRGWLVW
jgi:hypothetical protein